MELNITLTNCLTDHKLKTANDEMLSVNINKIASSVGNLKVNRYSKEHMKLGTGLFSVIVDPFELNFKCQVDVLLQQRSKSVFRATLCFINITSSFFYNTT